MRLSAQLGWVGLGWFGLVACNMATNVAEAKIKIDARMLSGNVPVLVCVCVCVRMPVYVCA